MTERMISNRLRKLKELENRKTELEKQIEALKEEIKQDMSDKGLEEQKVGDCTIRFMTIVTNRFDSKAFKKDHLELYNRYIKAAESKRFTIA